jgi:hypothetical protein
MNCVIGVALGCLLLMLAMAAVEPGVKVQVAGGTGAELDEVGRTSGF